MYKIKKFWLNLSDKIRFCIIGVINAIIAYLIYVFFLFILGKAFYQISLILSWVISSVSSFLLHRFFVFRVKGNILKQYIKCLMTWIVAYFINAVLLEIFVKNFHINPYISQIIATGLAAIFSFVAFKLVAFKKQD